MSEQEGEDPGRAFLLYLHAAVTQVTASAMRTRVERERRDRDRRQARRNQAYDASRAKRDAQAEADAARRATEHEARMELHKARLAETRERVRRMQESRNFAAKAGATREFQHTFDDLIGAFAAATATRDLSPEHEELAGLLAERLREQTGLDPDQVMADARQRMEKGPGWVDAGHVVTAEMADVLVEMQMDEDITEEVAEGGTAEGAAIAEQISRARVGEPPLGPQQPPSVVASERADGPNVAAAADRSHPWLSDPAALRALVGLISADPVRAVATAVPGPDRGVPARSGVIFVPSERLDQPADAEAVTGELIEGEVIAGHIGRARIGQLALPGSPGDWVPSEPVDEQTQAAQLNVAAGPEPERGAGL